ncbi:Serine acetyltransferase 3 [Arachis hypogaea]|nr:Serine acetyltransferase 3 [Arachis hypogaea]
MKTIQTKTAYEPANRPKTGRPPVAILRPLVSPSSAPVTLQSPSSPSPGSCPVALHLHPLLIFSTPATQHAVNTGSPPSPSRGPQQSTLSTGSPPLTQDNLKAVKERDPACINHVHCFLNFKGFLACQSHRVAHKLWLQGRKVLAVMIQNRVSEIFAVGIHPGAKIGSGILLDHVTGLVVGETAVIGNIVSILHSVTLGGTGKASGDRHPKIGDGVLIGAGTCILGNIKVGECAKIGAGSVVIKYVPPRTTVVSDFVIFYDVCI